MLDDAQVFFNNCTSNSSLSKYMFWNTHTSVDETQKMIEGFIEQYADDKINCVFAITLKDEVIGSIGCFDNTQKNQSPTAAFAYMISERYWGNGYATEALTAIIEYLFANGYHRIYADHDKRNASSGRVMKKCGLQYEGELRDKYFVNGEYVTVLQYAIVASDKKQKNQ